MRIHLAGKDEEHKQAEIMDALQKADGNTVEATKLFFKNRKENVRKWDRRFLDLARLVASWSKDPSTKTGAVIVDRNRMIVSAGYNGFPKGMPDDAALYADREEKYSRIVHCEMNALIRAREPVAEYTLYTWPFASCDRCAVHMIQAGIARFVFPPIPGDAKPRWAESLDRTKEYIVEAGAAWQEETI